MLRADSSVPLYKQLYCQLRTAIEEGDYQVGKKLPSERQLAAYHGISRLTARKAVEILRDEGYVRTFQGKGCYIARAKSHRRQGVRLQDGADRLLDHGTAPTSRLLSRGIVSATSEIALHLDLQPSDRIIRIRQLRSANGAPVALHTAYLPYPLCSPLLDIDLENRSLYQVLEEISGIRLDRVNQTVQTVLGSDDDLPLLGIVPPAAVLQLERETYDTYGKPIEYLNALYRDDVISRELAPRFLGS